MKLKTFKVAAFALLLLPCAAFAAKPTENPGRPQLGEPVTPHSINVDIRNLPVVPQWKPGQAIREAHKRQYHPLGRILPHAPADKPTAADRLFELQQIFDENAPASARARANNGHVSINNGNTGVSPGDPVVEVGTSHVMYGVNGSSGTSFTIYDKAGTKLAGPTSFKSLAPAGNACATSMSDPIILFDRLANRWFMLEMGGTSSNPALCTYVSKTSNPVTGGWWFYGFSTPSVPDYPHCGVWNNAYVCGDNEGNAQVSVYAFDRENMLNGATARPAQRFASVNKLAGYGFQILTPATFYGSTAPPAGTKQILARHNDDEAHAGAGADGTKDFIDLYEMTIDWVTPANSGITALPKINITEFNSWFRNYSTFATVPQPGSTSLLDPIREVLLNQLSYRNFGTHQSIVGTFATNQNAARTGTVVDSGVRWFELRKVGTGGWTLHQEGTFSPGDSNTHHLMGTAAMDKNGNIGLGYNVTKTSTPTVFATLRHSGRKAADPAGVMTLTETDDAVGSAAETSGRWGDYYQMTVDPADDCTFWHVGMYRPSGSWQTRITDFKFDDCTTGATFSVSGTITNGSGVGIGGVNVSNGSVSTTTNTSGTYTLTNLANGTYTITPSLSGYSFSPTNRSVTVNGANVTGQNFTGTATSNANPVANFTFTTSNLTATFTDSSTDSDGTIASRSWNFGDSTTSTTTNPSHTYAAAGTYSVALTVTDNGGATNTITKSVTVTAPPGNVLTNGVAVTGLAATTGNSVNYTMVVPAGATNLKFVMSGGTGDADMYVKFGSAPTDTVYDCRPYANGNAETCTITNIQAGTYYIRLKAYSSFSGVSLTGSYTEPCTSNCAQTYSNTADYNIPDNNTTGISSPIAVSGRTGNAPTNASISVNVVHPYVGDLKLDLIAPDGTVYNLRSNTGGSADNIVETYTKDLSSEALNGTWNLRAVDNAGADVGYINSWSVTF
ncbi:pre-peptidase C-terminal domain-containing protein [Lysobacter sp. CFH 32150]|uniref:pre-peptidase C-terminal domain-containing protein n=1 Tax=Lysobacter sp. CFH 32150 TaxID=2927128 RepID=UPI001FA78618|nr:pre-peptidase C-terminal domain-containing protein [Lysobacter sp. CFH 32150]MCI4567890.1 PKD domain-containing protein [Lysobacter sp. CFH 32150]